MKKMNSNKIFALDFEFKSSAERNYEIVSVSIREETGETRSWWLYKEDATKAEFKRFMAGINGATIISYAALAECRSLLSLGIDPLAYQWVDLYIEWRQLKNHNDLFKFGLTKNKDGAVQKSTPYHIASDFHKETGYGMVDCVLRMIGEDLNSTHKNQMRDLIINSEEFSENDKRNIMEYCESDVKYLFDVFNKMLKYYQVRLSLDKEPDMLKRGEFIACLSICERLGIPLDMPALRNIQGNHALIENSIVEEMNQIQEVFIKNKAGNWVFKANLFADLINSVGLENLWPKTATGKYASDSKTIEMFRHVDKVERLYQTLKTRKSINFVKDPRKSGEYIGTDGIIRPYFGPFGTQTGRNAAKATSFPPAMANWLRSIIRAPEGKAIIGIDYGSQEFAIGASLSGDKNMIEAYQSGDPYFYFAKKANAVSQDAERKDHEKIRHLFKETTLGLQYGMGINKLAAKLTADMGRKVDTDEARELSQLHKRVFQNYWSWLNHQEFLMYKEHYIQTEDGWMLFDGQRNGLSIKNFKVQGTGASIMRSALVKSVKSGLDVIFPLHDAIYFLCDVDDIEKTIDLAKSCMQDANREFIDIDVRMDVDIHKWDEIWVESRGRADWEKLKEFMYVL